MSKYHKNFSKLFDEVTRLQNLVSAYENDLVLLDVTEKLKKAEARIQELEDERRWISVDERLPEDSRVYDVAIAGYEYSWTGSLVFGKWIGESGKAILGVTHWKYRPQTPGVTHWKPQLPQEEE